MRPAAAVLGSPIAHSLSPLLHTAAYRALGWRGWSYERFETAEGQLSARLDADPERIGFSLTMPLKAEALELGSARGWRIEDVASRTGAGNTLIRFPDGPLVMNTDVAGIDEALSRAGARWDEAPFADVLGGGATAASAVAACAGRGIAVVRVHVREPARAAAARLAGERTGICVSVRRLGEWDPHDSLIAISTLPGAAADACAPALHALPPGAVLLNAAYSEAEPALETAWLRAGGGAVRGTAMLIGQAVGQFELFARAAVEHGVHPGPLPGDLREVVSQAMRDALG